MDARANPPSAVRSVEQMSQTSARFTQADIVGSIRAAKQAAEGPVELRTDGINRITLELAEEPKEAHYVPESGRPKMEING
jgi:hypothetical protein